MANQIHSTTSLPSIDAQVRYLMQGTRYGDDSLAETMRSELRARLLEADRDGRPLRVYCGFDPRTSDLHIGHTVPIRKLRAFQELGHRVTFVVGTFTSLIGDPSDKDRLRPILPLDEAIENGRTYAEQSFGILDPDLTTVRYNHEWLSELSAKEMIDLGSRFSVQRFLSRESFRKRWDAEEAVYLHELFYAIMQAYDAHYLKADVQIGGTDQLFNIITASRKLMSDLGGRPNIGIILDILPGTDGVVKMSKSLDNHIPIGSSPAEMYGKVMSIPDEAMERFFRLVTPLGPDEIDAIVEGVGSGTVHPRDAKMRLAREIVSVFHGDPDAKKAEEEFVRVFQSRVSPKEIPTREIEPGSLLTAVVVEAGLADSRSEVRRLIASGAVWFDHRAVDQPDYLLPDTGSGAIRIGKRRFLRVVVRPPG